MSPTRAAATTTATTLHGAVLELQAELPVVKRNTPGQVGTRSYKYADLGDVMAALQPLLTKHKLIYTVQPRQAERGDHYEIVGVLCHEPTGEQLTAALPLTGGTMPQQIGAALTYARRYLLSCLTGIITDEDTDGAGATDEPVRATRAQAPPAAPSPLDEARDRAVKSYTLTARRMTDPRYEFIMDDLVVAYRDWSGGKVLMEATADDLHRFSDHYDAIQPEGAKA